MTKYYKVVNSNLTSARVFRQEWRVWYQVGEFVRSPLKGSKLFCFNNLQAAQNFAYSSEDVYECEVIGAVDSKRTSGGFLSSTHGRRKVVELAWKLMGQKKKYKHLLDEYARSKRHRTPPKGTIFADAIKLVRRVV
jgi:hypothetical protein